jgi:ligand-binding sensor domain-containing protein
MSKSPFRACPTPDNGPCNRPGRLFAGFKRQPRALSISLVLAAALRGVAFAAAEPAEPVPPVPIESSLLDVASFAEAAGVPHRNVFGLGFEPDGTAWIACNDGLYRFDGYASRRFTVADGLPSNFTRSVCVTRGGRIWVGTDHGVAVYNGQRFEGVDTGRQLDGRSVRRIVEDPDGTLWFCCDPWPDLNTPCGLTSFHQGQWRTYRVQDGLPANHLYHYFRDSKGRQFALTQAGVAMRRGEGPWAPVASLGGPTNLIAWSAAESARGDVAFPGDDVLHVLVDGKWTQIPVPGLASTFPMATNKAGDLVVAWPGRVDVQLRVWTNGTFVPFGPSFPARTTWLESLRLAPDGALWLHSNSLLARWLPNIE